MCIYEFPRDTSKRLVESGDDGLDSLLCKVPSCTIPIQTVYPKQPSTDAMT